MSYYENQQWPAPAAAGQPSWEQQTPPARSGASSAVPREDSTAFSTQIEEVDRAIDNLVKSGKMFNMPGAGRRDSMPLVGASRTFPDQFDPRMTAGPPRHHSVSDFGDARSFSGSNLQTFYASQRHQPSRGANEAEQVMQAKRRMAAQRERELRNYHQEQQYNRSVTAEILGGKPDRTMSPGSGMSEDERRELIARQRSALYGEGAAAFSENGGFDENGTPRPATTGAGPQSALAASGIRGHSPLAFDHFNAQASQAENSNQKTPIEPQSATGQAPGQQRSRANSTSSPSSNPTSSFSLFESAAQQSSRTSTSSPGGSPPRQGGKAPTSGVAPIGTRPNQAANPALKQRSTTPLPSPLSYGFAANDSTSESKDTRTTSAASNPNPQSQAEGSLGWGSKGGVWGKNLGVQASVWG
ncbi:Herpes virus major outer envelope glyco BLLF1 protein [Rutstroemia sp. NJR-2017a BBW]|nr:Herpes virus major outer envelope glyco BLLF1 protein [Rutstroemia sp. NJR-2017a BBW]